MEPEKNKFASPFENRPSVKEAKAEAKKKAFLILSAVIIAAIVLLVIVISSIPNGKDAQKTEAKPTAAVQTSVEPAPSAAEETSAEPVPVETAEKKEQKKDTSSLFFLTCECIEPPFLDGELMAGVTLRINPDSTNTKNIDVDFVTLPGTEKEKHQLARIGVNWKDDEVFLMTAPVRVGDDPSSVVAEIRIYPIKGKKPAVFKIKRMSLIPFANASSELQLFAISSAGKNVSSDPVKKQKLIECINSVKDVDPGLKQAMIDALDAEETK